MPAEVLVFTNLAQFTNGVRTARLAAPNALRSALDRSLLLIEAEARQLAPRDTRRLQGSIHPKVTVRGSTLVGEVGPSTGYGLFVERGTKPHWPPRAPLEGWARRHNIPVFLVQRAIARHGTRPQPFIAPAMEHNAARIEQIFNGLGVTILGKIVG